MDCINDLELKAKCPRLGEKPSMTVDVFDG